MPERACKQLPAEAHDTAGAPCSRATCMNQRSQHAVALNGAAPQRRARAAELKQRARALPLHQALMPWSAGHRACRVLCMRWPLAAAGSAGQAPDNAGMPAKRAWQHTRLHPCSLTPSVTPQRLPLPLPHGKPRTCVRLPAHACFCLASGQRRVAKPSSFHTLEGGAGPRPWAHRTREYFKRDSGRTRGAPGGTCPKQAPPERLRDWPADGFTPAPAPARGPWTRDPARGQ
jgi:hypothetical protein